MRSVAVIGNLLHNQMILTPVAINAHGRIGPMARQNLYVPRKQFKPNRPNAKAIYDRATTLPAPIRIFFEADQRLKQLQADHPQHNQKFYGLSHYAPNNPTTWFRNCSRLQYPHHQFLQKACPLADITCL